MLTKTQRIRDPLHNLIEFGSDQFEHALWQVVQTAPFQRLRRIRQLGFSELVYPGATHTRFVHSVGAYHTARHLVRIIRQHIGSSGGRIKEHQVQVALAAALVHDVGHGMFSHAFEDVGKKKRLKMAEHETVSELLIREGEIKDALSAELGCGFANDVARVIGQEGPKSLYDAVVSSQFDADRLDYMQRDRLMTGVQNSGIDFIWLLNNLEVGEVPVGVDEEQSGTIDTFILGPKAIHAAETYVLSLFQLYPTVYFHKTTRGAEKVFSEIMIRIIELVRDGSTEKTGLPDSHPILRFANEPDDIARVLALDDTVFWGALPMMIEAQDPLISQFSSRLWQRDLPKCIDVHQQIIASIGAKRGLSPTEIDERGRQIKRIEIEVEQAIREWLISRADAVPRLLIDQAERHPYKRFQESKGLLNQISIRGEGGHILDMAEASPVVAGLKPFSLFRVYHDANDTSAQKLVNEIIKQKVGSDGDGNR